MQNYGIDLKNVALQDILGKFVKSFVFYRTIKHALCKINFEFFDKNVSLGNIFCNRFKVWLLIIE